MDDAFRPLGRLHGAHLLTTEQIKNARITILESYGDSEKQTKALLVNLEALFLDPDKFPMTDESRVVALRQIYYDVQRIRFTEDLEKTNNQPKE